MVHQSSFLQVVDKDENQDLKNFPVPAYCKMLMEDICYLELQLLHYIHYVTVYWGDNFLVAGTVNRYGLFKVFVVVMLYMQEKL